MHDPSCYCTVCCAVKSAVREAVEEAAASKAKAAVKDIDLDAAVKGAVETAGQERAPAIPMEQDREAGSALPLRRALEGGRTSNMK